MNSVKDFTRCGDLCQLLHCPACTSYSVVFLDTHTHKTDLKFWGNSAAGPNMTYVIKKKIIIKIKKKIKKTHLSALEAFPTSLPWRLGGFRCLTGSSPEERFPEVLWKQHTPHVPRVPLALWRTDFHQILTGETPQKRNAVTCFTQDSAAESSILIGQKVLSNVLLQKFTVSIATNEGNRLLIEYNLQLGNIFHLIRLFYLGYLLLEKSFASTTRSVLLLYWY